MSNKSDFLGGSSTVLCNLCCKMRENVGLMLHLIVNFRKNVGLMVPKEVICCQFKNISGTCAGLVVTCAAILGIILHLCVIFGSSARYFED